MRHKKKLIEVALPLDVVNAASAREKSIRHGHPGTLHYWPARRPLAAARAVLFAQMVDDPSEHPDLFPTDKKQENERQRLFRIIEDFVQWENTTNEEVLERARNEIWQSWRRTCAENDDHPRARELFDRHKLPAFHDPFAGGGTLPLEAQRLGLEAYASDLNPVAVLINKAMIEIPPKFAGRPPVNPEVRSDKKLFAREWKGAEGLAEDVRYYGRWIRDEAERRIGHLYPKVEVTAELCRDRRDLQPYLGRALPVIAWLWARTVKSPNPAFANVDAPLVSSFMLSAKPGREVHVQPLVEDGGYRFTVRLGKPVGDRWGDAGTKLGKGASFRCVVSDTPISGEYIKAEAKAGRLGHRMMAVVAECDGVRVFLPPTPSQESTAQEVVPQWRPDVEFFPQALGFRVGNYGMTKWSDLFTPRQVVVLSTFAELVDVAKAQVREHVIALDGYSDEKRSTADAYADAVAILLGLTASKAARFTTTLATWRADDSKLRTAFARNDIPITRDFAETNPFSGSGGDFVGLANGTASVIDGSPAKPTAIANLADACQSWVGRPTVVSTDPPYYDNIGYADLSDYFYVWLRRSLHATAPSLFATVATPKSGELVATPGRHGGTALAETYFLEGMTAVMRRVVDDAHPGFPVTIYYAFKQAEADTIGNASTGWETFLDAVVRAGFEISGTWPIRTEGKTRMRGMSSNALASSVVLVCRKRSPNARTATRREFLTALQAELPLAVANLQKGNIAPVDLAQAAIGPGMSVFTGFGSVVDAEGKALSIRQALALVNESLDEVLSQQEGDFDMESRWALAWFDQQGFVEGPYGTAETLSKAKNTSVDGMVEAGILTSKAGKVRLLRPDELPIDWDPEDDRRTNVWEMLHHLIRVLEHGGESAAAQLVSRYGAKADVVRELAYRLYTSCERRKRAKEAASYNGLVQSWPEVVRLANEKPVASVEQGGLFDRE